MLTFATKIVEQAEARAEKGATLTEVLPSLRKLSLDDFGLLLLSMPNSRWPHLTNVLPRMANEEVQKKYTGRCGIELFKQTSVFVRQIESNYIRLSGGDFRSKNVLDFGCGFGRLIRMMYYYTDPSKIFAIDSEDAPLKICKDDNVQASLIKSINMPNYLQVPSNSIDLAYSYSVFTHLPRYAAKACLDAVKNTLRSGGLFIITITPVEIWSNIGQDVNIERLTKQHYEEGFAHIPHKVHQHYGWSSMEFDFLRNCGWNVLHYDRSLDAPLQIVVSLQRP